MQQVTVSIEIDTDPCGDEYLQNTEMKISGRLCERFVHIEIDGFRFGVLSDNLIKVLSMFQEGE